MIFLWGSNKNMWSRIKTCDLTSVFDFSKCKINTFVNEQLAYIDIVPVWSVIAYTKTFGIFWSEIQSLKAASKLEIGCVLGKVMETFCQL